MVSKLNSMHQVELEMVDEFLSGIQMVEEVLRNRVSEELKTPEIAINLSPLLNDPLFCVLEKQNKNQVSIQDFLKLIVARWREEIQYQQDILILKDQIIDEFNQLCIQMKNANFIEDIKKQCQETVETLFIQINFDKKHLAGDFCKCFMNGFENEMIKKIEYYANYVVWMPFITPLPKELIEIVKKTFHDKIKNQPTKEKIVSASAIIKQYIKDQLKEKEIQVKGRIHDNNSLPQMNNIIEISQLATILKAAQVNRIACTLVITEVDKDNNIISNERKNIQTIIRLELKDVEDEDNFEQVIQILQRLPKCLKTAFLQFENKKKNGIQIINKDQEQKHTYELSFDQTDISCNQIEFNVRLSKHIQFPLTILTFKYEHYSKETDKEIITLSNIFTHSKIFEHLHLNFFMASITTDAIDNLAASISKMNRMKYLNIDFGNGNNSAKNNSMGLFAQAISEMASLCHLKFNFSCGNNEITNDGIGKLSQAIAKSVNIQQLILKFGNSSLGGGKNAVTDKGIEELSQSIAHLNSIQQLRLDFSNGNHRISDKGMQTLAATLKNTNKISDLYLDFSCGKNSITDASMDPLVDALKRMPSQLDIYLNFSSNKSQRVTIKGQSIIRKARAYKSFYVGYSKQQPE